MSDRSILLQYILPLVPFDGWTEHALIQAAKCAGLDNKAVKHAFPGGAGECLDYFFSEEDKHLAKAFPKKNLTHLRVPERIETLLLWRLDHFLPYREAVRRGVAERALPWNAARACRSLYRTVDLMWRLAGDASTDFSFYTKRMTLAAVYTSTLLCWLGDHSPEQTDTKAFLKRRLENVAGFGKWKKECKNILQQKKLSW